MNYRKLGKTDLKVSEVGFGAWAIGGNWGHQDDKDSLAALHKAIDLGINFIDTAAGYGNGRSERIIGKVLKERSEEIIVATKTPPAPGPWPPTPYCRMENRYPEHYLRQNIEERLQNLGTDCIDILQLHTWTRAWNHHPAPFEILHKLREEGKIRFVGVSTPEDDQHSVIDLMKNGYVDVVQLIYNIFEQEPAAELLPAARKHQVGTIIRVVFDEGALTGKFGYDTTFAADDFRRNYFAGDRLHRTVKRVEKIKQDIKDTSLAMPQVALRFVLDHPAVSTVIPGIRNISQAEKNIAVSELPPLSEAVHLRLRNHAWRRAFWYAGK
jgi:aryl-alcohol dehydrogenase-like predicted oxidoreductase